MFARKGADKIWTQLKHKTDDKIMLESKGYGGLFMRIDGPICRTDMALLCTDNSIPIYTMSSSWPNTYFSNY